MPVQDFPKFCSHFAIRFAERHKSGYCCSSGPVDEIFSQRDLLLIDRPHCVAAGRKFADSNVIEG